MLILSQSVTGNEIVQQFGLKKDYMLNQKV